MAYARAGARSVVGYFTGDPHDVSETVRLVEEAGGDCVPVAIVTGAASGIGGALADLYLSEGAAVLHCGLVGRCGVHRGAGAACRFCCRAGPGRANDRTVRVNVRPFAVSVDVHQLVTLLGVVTGHGARSAAEHLRAAAGAE